MEEQEVRQILKRHICYEGPHMSSFAAGFAASDIAEAAAADKADALSVQDAAWHEIEDKHLARIEELEAENKALWTALARGDDGTID